MHPLIPDQPSVVIVCADDGEGKTTHICGAVTELTKAGKRVVYVTGSGEGDPEKKVKPLIAAAGGNVALVTFVDCEAKHDDVTLANMTEHDAIKPHLAGAAALVIETLSSFDSESIKRGTISRRLKQFHQLARNGVTTFLAMHPNRSRTKLRKPADALPAGWGSKVDVVWVIEPSDQKGHHVLEMARGRDYQKPWEYYPGYITKTEDGIKLGVLEAKNTGKRIVELWAEKNPNHLAPAVSNARTWLLDYLKTHGERLVETEVFPDGKAAGMSEPSLVRAKAVSPEIGHTPQGAGPSKWFLKPDSVDSVTPSDGPKQNQQTRSRDQAPNPAQVSKAKRLSLFRYPGGKYKEAPYYASIIGQCETIFEPFVGGGHVSMFCLLNDVAKRAWINDIDPGVAAFWQVLFGDSDSNYRNLRMLIDRTPTDAEFARLKEDATCDDCSVVERAFHAFYLHRTTFGGLGTSGRLKDVDSRYNASRHVAEMERLRAVKGKVTVTCGDFADCIAHAGPGDFIYPDPPYVGAGAVLYTKPHQLMIMKDHERLQVVLSDADRRGVRFLLSYDDDPNVRAMYAGFNVHNRAMSYSIDGARTSNKTKNELLITNVEVPPAGIVPPAVVPDEPPDGAPPPATLMSTIEGKRLDVCVFP